VRRAVVAANRGFALKRPASLRFAPLRAEVYLRVHMHTPPPIPDFDSPFKHHEMFGIRHDAFRYKGPKIFKDIFPPRVDWLPPRMPVERQHSTRFLPSCFAL